MERRFVPLPIRAAISWSQSTLTVSFWAGVHVPSTKEILIEGTWTPAQNDFDMYIEDANGNVFAANSSTANPSAIILPVPADGTVYHVVVEASVGAGNLAGLIQ